MAASEERRDLCADTGTPEHSAECRERWAEDAIRCPFTQLGGTERCVLNYGHSRGHETFADDA